MKTRFKEFYWDENGNFVLELLNGEKYMCNGTYINGLKYTPLQLDSNLLVRNEKKWDVNDLQRIKSLSGGLTDCTIPQI